MYKRDTFSDIFWFLKESMCLAKPCINYYLYVKRKLWIGYASDLGNVSGTKIVKHTCSNSDLITMNKLCRSRGYHF